MNDFHQLISTNKSLHKARLSCLRLGRFSKNRSSLLENGFATKLVISLVCTYSDMVSDMLMLRFYHTTGDHKSFDTSLKILVLAMSAHVINSLSQNKHCNLKTKAIRVLQTLCLLNPLVYTYGKWSGKPKEVGSITTSSELLMLTKAHRDDMRSVAANNPPSRSFDASRQVSERTSGNGCIQTATSTTLLTHLIRLARSLTASRFSRPPPFASVS